MHILPCPCAVHAGPATAPAYLAAAGVAGGGVLLGASGSSLSILGSRGGMIGLVTLSRSTTAASCEQLSTQCSTEG
jgi:hypothetical protein